MRRFLSLAAPFVKSDIQSPTIVRRVGTLADLQALDGSAVVSTVYLVGRTTPGDGGEGHFRWVSGDQSANVTADTQSGIWVAGTDGTGVGGAWKRQYSGPGRLEWFGVVPNDSGTDYKTKIDAAMAVLSEFELNGDYYLSNLEFPNKRLSFVSLNGMSYFRTIDGAGDPDYFAAPLLWINSSSSASRPITLRNIGFDGGTKNIALVVHWYFGDAENLRVEGGVNHAVLMTAQNRDGSFISSTMVNNRFRNIWIQGTAAIGFEVAEDGKSTDYHIEGGYIFNSGGTNLNLKVLAGAWVSGVHCYGSAVSAKFKKWSGGTRIAENYFEGDVEIIEGLNNTNVFKFGPANTVKGSLVAKFGDVAGPVHSFNNHIGDVLHAYFGSKQLVSVGDTLVGAAPIAFFNTSTGNTAVIEVIDGFIDGERRSGLLSPALRRTGKSSLVKVDRIAAAAITPLTKSQLMGPGLTTTDISFDFTVGTIGASGGSLVVDVTATEVWNSFARQSAYTGRLIFNYARGSESAGHTKTVDVVFESGDTTNMNLTASAITQTGSTGDHVVTCTVTLTHPERSDANSRVYASAVLKGYNVSGLR